MNKKDVWQVIKAALKLLVGVVIFFLLFQTSGWHINSDEALSFLGGVVAGWAITAWHYEKKRKEDKWWEK